MTFFELVLAGLIIGVFVGVSGVGGGSIMTPVLMLLAGMNPLAAVGTDLLYSVPTKLLGATVHHRQGTVNWRLVRYLVLGGVPAAVVGLVTLSALQQHLGLDAVNNALKRGLGYTLMLVSVAIVLKPLLLRWSRRSEQDDAIVWTRGEVARVITLGAVVGFMVSLTSIGSGSLTVPMLYFLVPRLGIRRLVGSDVAFAAILIPVAAAGHLQMGHVNLGLAASLLAGSLPGVVVGSRLCARVPDIWFRPALAGALLFAGSRLI